jgi:hypothetical protein
MKTKFKTVISAAGLAIFAAAFAPMANAGCGDAPGKADPSFGRQPGFYMMQAAYRPGWFAPVGDRESDGAPIVGMWKVEFDVGPGVVPPLPNGGIFDWGYSQWHSDGTEILNSGGRAPATENFCLGVWKRTGHSTYKLNHFALSYNASSGLLDAMVNIHEDVKLDRSGNSYSGNFSFDVYDAQGKLVKTGAIVGTITGVRITAD